MTGKTSRPARRNGSGARGFTLIEMLVTLVIAAVLLTIGVPSFNDAALGSKVSNIANNMAASVQLARGEAIKRNVPITLCRSSNGLTCAGSGDWEQGWIVVDLAPDPDVVFQHQQAAPTGFKVLRTVGAGNVTFQPIGVGATQASFKVCRASPVGKQERVVLISATGMTSVTTTETAACP